MVMAAHQFVPLRKIGYVLMVQSHPHLNAIWIHLLLSPSYTSVESLTQIKCKSLYKFPQIIPRCHLLTNDLLQQIFLVPNSISNLKMVYLSSYLIIIKQYKEIYIVSISHLIPTISKIRHIR
jgi:hypothetical protein